jgi:hypothetical protein
MPAPTPRRTTGFRQPASRSAQQQPECAHAREHAQDDQREGVRGEPVEEVPGVGAQHGDTDETDRRDRGSDGPAPEVARHLCVTEPAGVPHEVDGRQVGHRGDGERPAEHGGGVDPAVHRVARPAARGYAAGRDATGDRSEDP